MPRDCFEGQDESYDHVKASFADIQEALQLRRALYNSESQEAAINSMVEDIWAQEIGAAEKEMRKNQCQRFLHGFVKKNNPKMEVSEAAFEEFFEQLDVNKNGKCSKDELGAFLLKFTA